jgi:hypothetical protein
MSSSAPSTPSNNLSDVFSAMNEETPVAPSPTVVQKRNHAAMAAGNSDDDNDNAGTPTFALPNQNVITAVRRYAERKRLRGEQLTEATIFVQVSTSLFFRRLGQYSCLSLQGHPCRPRDQTAHQSPASLERARQNSHFRTAV